MAGELYVELITDNRKRTPLTHIPQKDVGTLCVYIYHQPSTLAFKRTHTHAYPLVFNDSSRDDSQRPEVEIVLEAKTRCVLTRQ